MKKKLVEGYDLFKTDYPPLNSILVEKKLEQFFDEIEKYNLFTNLGIQEETYLKFKKYAPELKSNYIRRLFF